jgi:calcineurin-like phosphoesterase family protein
MKVFASSDHHFFHKNIIKYADRPFDFDDENCVGQCAKHMIEMHNSVISDNDFVLMVGDLSAGLRGRTEMFSELLKLLKGKKILVRGNHDYLENQFYLDAGFLDVVDYFKIPPYFISHYPCYLSKWTTELEKNVMQHVNLQGYHTIIHGHIHNKNPDNWYSDGFKRINVCVDYTPNEFKPVELRYPEVQEFLKKRYT